MSSLPFVPPRPGDADYKHYRNPSNAQRKRRERLYAPPCRPNVALEHLERVKVKSMMSTKNSDMTVTGDSMATTESQRGRKSHIVEMDSVPESLILRSKAYQSTPPRAQPPQLEVQSPQLRSQPQSSDLPCSERSPSSSQSNDVSDSRRLLNLHKRYNVHGIDSEGRLDDPSSRFSMSTTETDTDMADALGDTDTLISGRLQPHRKSYADPETSPQIESGSDHSGNAYDGEVTIKNGHGSRLNSLNDLKDEGRYIHGLAERVSGGHGLGDDMDVDDQELPIGNENDSSSLLGRSSITTINDSPIRYVQGRDIGLPSSSPRLPAAPRYQTAVDNSDRYSGSSDIPSSPPIAKNRFQEAWDLQEQSGQGWSHMEMYRIRQLHEGVAESPVVDRFSNLISGDTEQSRLLKDASRRTIAPLSFDDMQKLREAGKVLRKRGREQDYHDFLRAVGVPQAGAATVGQLLNHHMDAMREQMNDHVPSNNHDSPQLLSTANMGSQYPSPPYGTLQPSPTSSGDFSNASTQSRFFRFFAVPPMPPMIVHLRSSGDGQDGMNKHVRKKLSLRKGLARVFPHTRKSSSDGCAAYK